ncbi:MAG: right-handed parallel beta-helix repeat-containing protein [Deltaproteobacteria bacterium]|nr:right-handed parallel beta-helix repeat-containing protein [Deltaproteobacteria bacterium]
MSCSFGTCHEACKETRDCPLGQRCVKDASNFNVCQLPAEQRCTYNSDCKQPLVCATDFQCRNQCVTSVDCTKGQSCVESVCADPSEIDPVTGKLKPGTPPVMTPVDGGGTDALAPGADGGQGIDAGTGADAAINTPVPVDAVIVDKPLVRQGELGVLITVTAPAGLAGATEPTVGDCRATIQDGNTATSVTIRVSCLHGSAIGPKDLSFKTSSGVVTKAAVLSVTAITASPTGLDTNRGTTAEPYRTFKKALSVADAGDTISLLDGTYDKDGGEDFKDPIPSGVTIVGQSAAGTKLVGLSTVDGLVLNQPNALLTVKNLTVSYFRYGVSLTKPAKLTFENVKISNAQYYGIYVQNGENVEISFSGDDSAITETGSYSAYLYGKNLVFTWKGKGTIGSSTTTGFYLSADKGAVNIEDATVAAKDATGIAFTATGASSDYSVIFNKVIFTGGVNIDGKEKTLATFTKSTVNRPNTGSYTGLDFNGLKLTVTDSSFVGGGTSVDVRSGDATFRNTKFQGYYYYGLRALTETKTIDLGTAAQPGANAFNPDPAYSNSYAIYDARPMSPNNITVSETTLSDSPFPTGTYTGTLNTPKRWYIQAANNKIIVY